VVFWGPTICGEARIGCISYLDGVPGSVLHDLKSGSGWLHWQGCAVLGPFPLHASNATRYYAEHETAHGSAMGVQYQDLAGSYYAMVKVGFLDAVMT
jgi:hypothetical protein